MIKEFAKRLHRFFAKKHQCRVCGVTVIEDYPNTFHPSSLAPFSGTGCPSCIVKRAETVEMAMWYFESETGIHIGNMEILDVIDANGSKNGFPVHIYADKRYVPLVEWIETNHPSWFEAPSEITVPIEDLKRGPIP